MNAPPRFRRLSPPGVGALSLWRLEGAEERLLSALGSSSLPSEDRPRLIRIPAGPGEVLDQGLLLRRGSGVPVVVELHLHGGIGVARGLRRLLRARGFQEDVDPADRDEWRFRRARTPLAARAAARWRGGAWEGVLERLHGLESAAAAREARELLSTAPWAEVLESPPRIVLAGPPNAGKSTLFNAWVDSERVTVSPRPGTTRDAVEAGILLGEGDSAFEAVLVDTAGLGGLPGCLEQAAEAATRAELDRSWRILWVLDATRAPGSVLRREWETRPQPGLRLLHRSDLPSAWDPQESDFLRGSVLREGKALIRRLEKALLATLPPVPEVGQVIVLGADRRATLRQLAQFPGVPSAGDP